MIPPMEFVFVNKSRLRTSQARFDLARQFDKLRCLLGSQLLAGLSSRLVDESGKQAAGRRVVVGIDRRKSVLQFRHERVLDSLWQTETLDHGNKIVDLRDSRGWKLKRECKNVIVRRGSRIDDAGYITAHRDVVQSFGHGGVRDAIESAGVQII